MSVRQDVLPGFPLHFSLFPFFPFQPGALRRAAFIIIGVTHAPHRYNPAPGHRRLP